jgi:SAM-dependent methyltransferase
VGSDDEVLSEQRAYYRGRAPEYDEWWQRRGRYDMGEEETRDWNRQVATVDAALRSFGIKGDVLELAGGTGWWTERLARTADRLTVLDAAPEALALNRQRVGREDVSFVVADLFDWRPERAYDVVFFSFGCLTCQGAASVPSGALCGPHCDQPVECASSTIAETTRPPTLKLRGIHTWSSTGLTFIAAAWAMAPNISWSR